MNEHQLTRIADALERIADSLQQTPASGSDRSEQIPIRFSLDDREVAKCVTRYTLSRAGRGPATLTYETRPDDDAA